MTDSETDRIGLPRFFEAVHGEIPGSDGSRIGVVKRSIFWLLHDAKGRIVTHRSIWDAVYGIKPECDWPASDVVKVHVCQLRKKLPGWKIETAHGLGYRMVRREENDGQN